jgi:oxalate decarboxylase/phosphoglucose isomerase-like protein (cupin superfamily)
MSRSRNSKLLVSTAARIDAIERTRLAINAGQTPLEFLLEVMRDANHDLPLRLEAARAAAPYIHKRLPTDLVIDHTMRQIKRIEFVPSPGPN